PAGGGLRRAVRLRNRGAERRSPRAPHLIPDAARASGARTLDPHRRARDRETVRVAAHPRGLRIRLGDRLRADELEPLELLVAHGAPDRPRVLVPASSRCRIDHPAHAMHETRVVVEVALQRGPIFEEHAVPEAAGTPRAEPTAAHGGRYRV